MPNNDETISQEQAIERLVEHAPELLTRASRACRSLRAAAKIMRAQGNPRSADIVQEHADLLAETLRKVGIER